MDQVQNNTNLEDIPQFSPTYHSLYNVSSPSSVGCCCWNQTSNSTNTYGSNDCQSTTAFQIALVFFCALIVICLFSTCMKNLLAQWFDIPIETSHHNIVVSDKVNVEDRYSTIEKSIQHMIVADHHEKSFDWQNCFNNEPVILCQNEDTVRSDEFVGIDISDAADDDRQTNTGTDDGHKSNCLEKTAETEQNVYESSLLDEQIDVCSICLDQYKVDEIVSVSLSKDCRHIFHHRCIKEWLLKHDSCPTCRVVLVLDDKVSRKLLYPQDNHDSGIEKSVNRDTKPVPLVIPYYCIKHNAVHNILTKDMLSKNEGNNGIRQPTNQEVIALRIHKGKMLI